MSLVYIDEIITQMTDDFSQATRAVSKAVSQLADVMTDYGSFEITITNDQLPKWCQEKIQEFIDDGIYPGEAREMVLMDLEYRTQMEETIRKDRSAWIRQTDIRATTQPRCSISLWKDTGYRARSTC